MKSKRRLPLFALIAGGFFQTSAGFAYVLLSGPLEAKLAATNDQPQVLFHWDASTVSLTEKEKINNGIWNGLNPEDFMEQLIQLAMDQWNHVPGSFVQLKLVKDASVTINREDFIHSISVKKESNVTTSAFAQPIIEKNGKDYQIVDCDITIGNRSTTAMALAYTITHELGHCLGLGHAHSNYGSIMGYARPNRSLDLGVDDWAGVIYLYPDAAYGDTPPLPFKCGSITSSPASSRLPAAWLLLLPLLWVFVRRWRQSSTPPTAAK